MSVRNALVGVIVAAAAGSPAIATPTAQGAPCGEIKCPADIHPEAARLNEAWWSEITTDAERLKMDELIKANSVQGAPNWPAASLAYFNWRASEHGYTYDPNPKPHVYTPPPPPPWGAMRQAAEDAIRGRLIDPSSAQFEWPFGFFNGSWKPLLQKRIPGWITCGEVNARNRMGGYVGRSAFVVVVQGTQVVFDDMDSGDTGLVGMACQKSAASFPAPQNGMLDMPRIAAPAGGVDVADEIAKLAALREKGILTPAEFEAQKAKLLNQ